MNSKSTLRNPLPSLTTAFEVRSSAQRKQNLDQRALLLVTSVLIRHALYLRDTGLIEETTGSSEIQYCYRFALEPFGQSDLCLSVCPLQPHHMGHSKRGPWGYRFCIAHFMESQHSLLLPSTPLLLLLPVLRKQDFLLHGGIF